MENGSFKQRHRVFCSIAATILALVSIQQSIAASGSQHVQPAAVVAASTQQQQKQCLLLQHILAVSNDTLVPPAGTPPSEAISAPPLAAANNALLQWMQANGAQINVNVTYAGPDQGCVVVATQPLKRGDLLAAIPVDLCWSIATDGGNGTMELAAANLWAEIENPASPWRPYLDSLPSQEDMLCPFVSLPPEYKHLIQDEYVEEFINGYQANIINFWEEFGSEMASQLPSMSLDTFKYARSLLATRLFGLATSGPSLVPLLDAANHAPLCPNFYSEQPCPNQPERTCILWSAGSYHSKGSEVCNGYKHMFNDRSALQYGFLQAGFIKDRLHMMDHPSMTSAVMFSAFDKLKFGPAPFTGNREETQTELARLQGRLANVSAGDAAAAATKVAWSDPGGRMLGLMLRWREERKAALQAEILRQEQRLANFAALDSLLPGQQMPAEDPLEKLVEWLTTNGAQINGVEVGWTGRQGTVASHSAAASSDAGSTPLHGGRAVFATGHIKQGSVMAAIPLDLALPVDTANMLLDGPRLFTEVTQHHCPRAAYYATLPRPHEVFSLYNIPLEYAPLVQHTPTENYLQSMAQTLDALQTTSPELFSTRNMIMADMQYIFTLVVTRLINLEEGGHLIPLIDMANHRQDCPKHHIDVVACDQVATSNKSAASSSKDASTRVLNTTRLCVIWTAGADLSAGDEVCRSYGYLLPDRTFLQYGFIPTEFVAAKERQQSLSRSVAVPLFGMDRADFQELAEESLPWTFWLDRDTGPEPFRGGWTETIHEIKRLECLLKQLDAGDAAAAAVKPNVHVDPNASLLTQIKLWRQLRKTAIAQEIKRLQQQQELH